MKKSNLFLVMIFAGLGATAWYFLKFKKLNNSRGNSWEMQFSVPDARKSVHKIRLTDHLNRQILLEKKPDGWILNGKYKARATAVDLLVETIRQLAVKYVPTNAAVPNMLESIATDGIRTDIFDKNGKILKTIYIGGVTPDDRGTFCMLSGSNQPFVVHVPSHEGTLRSRFMMVEQDWRDRTIFAEKPEQIQEISVEYPQYQSLSFRLSKVDEAKFEVNPFYPNQPKIAREVTRGKAESYLLQYESLIAEGFENNNPRRDSVLALVPFARISVKKIDGTSKMVQLFPIWQRDIDGNFIVPEDQSPFSGKIERFFAWKSPDNDFMLTQFVVMGKLFANYPWFFEPVNAGLKN